MNSIELNNMINNYKTKLMQAYQKAVPISETVSEIKTYDQFLKNNPGSGVLKVQVSAAQQSIPIKDVRIIIKKDFPNETKVFFDVTTDSSGIVDNLQLPAPTKALSENINFNGLPYSTYIIEASHPEYQNVILDNVSIFDGVKSVQPINLIPQR